MVEWCYNCEAEIKGLAKTKHDMARAYAQDLAPSILDKPKEWRKHLLSELSEKMCLLCGGKAPCYCASCYDE